MEFHTRGTQSNSGRHTARQDDSLFTVDEPADKPKKVRKRVPVSLRQRKIVVVICAIIAFLIVLGAYNLMAKTEAKLVDNSKHQVVALSDDRAFFGKLTSFSEHYIVLEDVFYLENAGTDSAESAAQLIKRGCEPWRPTDRMVIYRSDVLFWENIQDDGQIAKIIAQWKEQNPDGQTCNTTNTTTQTPTTTTPTADTSEPETPTVEPPTTE